MSATMSNVQIYTKATSVGLGKDVNVHTANKLTIQIIGTSTTHLIKFYGSLDYENYSLLEGIKQGDTTVTANNTTGIDELWYFDISTLVSFRAKIDSISDGYISINAIAVV